MPVVSLSNVKQRRLISRSIVLMCALFIPAILQAQQLERYKDCFNHQLKPWAQSFRQFKLPGFKRQATLILFEAVNSTPPRFPDEFYPAYKAALSFSADGKYAIDIYSNQLLEERQGKFSSPGEDVEQGIYLGNIPARKWVRIAYNGYALRAQEVCWVDNDTFILAAVFNNKAGKDVPQIRIGHIRQKMFEVFTSIKPNCYQNKAGYLSPKIKALHVKKL